MSPRQQPANNQHEDLPANKSVAASGKRTESQVAKHPNVLRGNEQEWIGRQACQGQNNPPNCLQPNPDVASLELIQQYETHNNRSYEEDFRTQQAQLRDKSKCHGAQKG